MSDAPEKDNDEQNTDDRDTAWFATLTPAERPKVQDPLQEIDRVLGRMLKNVDPSTPRQQ